MAKKTPEGEIQSYGAEQLKKHGCLVRKISYEGRRGCPDQLVLVPERQHIAFHRPAVKTAMILGAGVLFIEYKRDELITPEPHQLREHERLRQHGGDVRVIGSKAQVDALIEELFGCQ